MNWVIRFKNPVFVAAFVSKIFILLEILFIGFHEVGWVDVAITEEMEEWVLLLVNAIFGVLAMIGVVQDPTVEGIKDADMTRVRKEPYKQHPKRNFP